MRSSSVYWSNSPSNTRRSIDRSPFDAIVTNVLHSAHAVPILYDVVSCLATFETAHCYEIRYNDRQPGQMTEFMRTSNVGRIMSGRVVFKLWCADQRVSASTACFVIIHITHLITVRPRLVQLTPIIRLSIYWVTPFFVTLLMLYCVHVSLHIHIHIHIHIFASK